MRYFELSAPHSATPRTWNGTCRVERQWGLPGVECSKCGQTWSAFRSFPAVDVSQLPERHELENLWPKPYAEYARLAERVRPLCPTDVVLTPGSMLGPLHGTARGRLGPVTLVPLWGVLIREDLLQALQVARIRGIIPVSPKLKKPPSPPVFELHLLPGGRLHPDCLLPDPSLPCSLCGWEGTRWYPNAWVDASSLPTDLDVFRLEDNPMYIVASERFIEAARSCGVSDVVFTEVSTAPPAKAPRG